MIIPVFAQEIRSILQGAKRNVERNSHKLSVHCIAGQQLRLKQRDLGRQVGPQIDQIGFENRRPDQIDVHEIGAGAILQQLACQFKVVASVLRNRNTFDANLCFLRELLQQSPCLRSILHPRIGVPQRHRLAWGLPATDEPDSYQKNS